MNPKCKTLLVSFLVLLSSCITQFIPQTNEDKKLLVVEGLITNLPDTNIIFLSESLPLGTKASSNPVSGCIVTISDDLGNSYDFTETSPGKYVTSPSKFQGITGRFYTLHIIRTGADNNSKYESSPVEMKYDPPIDSLYYERSVFNEINGISSEEGCQVYLNTHDPTNQAQFYRWEYSETWELILPYTVPNKICWVTSKSDIINIKSTTILEKATIRRYPVNFISNETDRLRVKYSILVKQYSLNEDEYQYWEKLQNITEQVGGLYDMIPSSIPSNIYNTENPNEKVLGYFSVSGATSKRLFIEENFAGIFNLYTDVYCIEDTIFNDEPIPSLNSFVWVIVDHPIPPPPYKVITRNKGCYDCTLRGTTIKPDFWN